MKKPHILFVGVIILFLGFRGGIGWSQENDPRTMSARSFEAWCSNLQGRGENINHKSEVPAAQQELMAAQELLLDRLRQDKWTSDEAILTMLSA